MSRNLFVQPSSATGWGWGGWLCVSSCLTKPATEEENGVVRLLARCDHEDWHLTTLWPGGHKAVEWVVVVVVRAFRFMTIPFKPYKCLRKKRRKKTNGSVYCISFRGVISSKTYKYIEQLNHRIWATIIQSHPIYHGNIITSWKCTT